MTSRERRLRARVITKAQRARKQEKITTRAVRLLVESDAAQEDGALNTLMPIAPGESIRAGDTLYLSKTYPGCVTSTPEHSIPLGTAAGSSGSLSLTGGIVAVRLRS